MNDPDLPIDLGRAVAYLALHLEKIHTTFSDAERGRVVNLIRKRMHRPEVGDLVIEWMTASLLVGRGRDPMPCIGRLQEIIPGHSEYTTQWVIKLVDGSTVSWSNCRMIAIPEALIGEEGGGHGQGHADAHPTGPQSQ